MGELILPSNSYVKALLIVKLTFTGALRIPTTGCRMEVG